MLNVELRPLADIKPYEKNPRINDAAVDAVAESIRQLEFRQPIVVDEAGVIVCGHTWLEGGQKLGLAEVPVHVARDLTPGRSARTASRTTRPPSWRVEPRAAAHRTGRAAGRPASTGRCSGSTPMNSRSCSTPACSPASPIRTRFPSRPTQPRPSPAICMCSVSIGCCAATALPRRPTWTGCSTASRFTSSTWTRRTTSRSNRTRQRRSPRASVHIPEPVPEEDASPGLRRRAPV